ncbi:RNA methyltransferase [Roseovarius sp. SCSIO 43702]|uniref:RNA methyltransferase n=1 Tax=Roseovarius sp. SCSIO 43702 TaxID=2823043 RepID=UPI001C72ED03|nr:RNA methyltransferase [Roseovarius sp. SCSIO 43702]QYX55467.1 RNA methyltransferase [Roseovarius sp. SCSIO 43702]
MPTDTPQPSFVLVRPQMGENIGAAARAMWNFGLDRMQVVSPRDGWPNPKAVAMASGAGRLLDEARLVDSVDAAVAECSFVLATTARSREMTKPVYSPEAAMRETAKRVARGEKVAVLFGPERAGLDNDDVARASAIVTVPVNPAFPSLNLAQCALLLGYEWRRAQGGVTEVEDAPGETGWATREEVARLARHYEDRMDEAGFFFPEHKAANMRRNLLNFWSRMPMTQADVRMMHGVLRQMVRWKDRG